MRTAVLLVLVAVLALSPATLAFETIPSGHWAAQAVEDLHSEGVLIGYPDGTFRGANAATRYELAIALKRLENVVQGLASNARVAGATEGSPAVVSVPDLSADVAKLKELVDALTEAVKQDQKDDARRDKALNDLTDSVLALEAAVKTKADRTELARLDELQKALDDLKVRLAAVLDQNTVKAMIQAETSPLKDQLSRLSEENSVLKADLAQQKSSLTRLYWMLAAVGVVAIVK